MTMTGHTLKNKLKLLRIKFNFFLMKKMAMQKMLTYEQKIKEVVNKEVKDAVKEIVEKVEKEEMKEKQEV